MGQSPSKWSSWIGTEFSEAIPMEIDRVEGGKGKGKDQKGKDDKGSQNKGKQKELKGLVERRWKRWQVQEL